MRMLTHLPSVLHTVRGVYARHDQTCHSRPRIWVYQDI